MNVLIIGGGGDVGRIINRAIEAVHDVTHLDLNPVAGAENRTIVGSISDDAVVTRAVQGQDALIFAALGTIKGEHKRTCETIDVAFNVNLRDQYRVLSIALKHGVRHFTTISTMDVYGGIDFDYVIDEDNTPTKAFVKPYGASKRLAEMLYVSAAKHYPDGVFLVLRFNLPMNEDVFQNSPRPYDPALGRQNNCATGPNDTRRLMLAALACMTKGCHIVQTSGDLAQVKFSTAKATALLGWKPQGD